MEYNIGDDMFINTFYTPLVENETDSCMNGFYSFRDNAQFFNYIDREHISDNMYNFSDDSVEDPNFEVDSSETEDDSDESIMQENLTVCAESPNNKALVGADQLVEATVEIDMAKTYFTRKEIKRNRNRGEAYVTKTKKQVASRKCEPLRSCRRKCKDVISYEDQKNLFKTYWELGSYNQRFIFISSLIEVEEKASQTLKKNVIRPKNRQKSILYHIETNGKRSQVCKTCFLATFGETPGFLRNVISKKSCGKNTLKDNRGMVTPSNKFSDEKITSIKNHIKSFPAYESHYSRSHTSKKYLSSSLSISKMHELYCNENEAVSLSKYSELFHSMNYKFKQPKIDTCNKCDTFKAKTEYMDVNDPEYKKTKDEQEIHHQKADLAYKAKENDKIITKNNANIKMFTFDLQQCLPTPYLTTSVSYYKRQLNTYNLTIHDCETNESYCYMWHEGEGRRGANEISSCLFNHLNSINLNTSINSIIFYSDSCAGQNKNSYVSLMFTHFLQSSEQIKTIDHKFLEPGHTHMECDVDHALIERKKKSTDMKIHHPRDWLQFVRSIGKKNMFMVQDMDHTKFYNFSSLAKNFISLKKNAKDDFSWKNVKWLRYSKEKIGIIEFKNSLSEDEPFKIVSILKRGVKLPDTMTLQIVIPLPKISKEKKKDLLSLLPLIDPSVHDFYKNLNADNIPDLDPDIFSECSDEE